MVKRKKRGARTTFSASDAIPPTDPGERQHIDIKLYNAPTIYGFRCLLRSICRVTEGKGSYTNLSLPGGVGMTEKGDCCMKQFDLDHKSFDWVKVGRPT